MPARRCSAAALLTLLALAVGGWVPAVHAAPSTNGAPPVNVSLYAEALCPYW